MNQSKKSLKKVTKKVLNNHYYDLNYPTAYTGVHNIYKTLKSKGYDVSIKNVLTFLLQQGTYVYHRQAKNKYRRRRTVNSFLKPGFQLFVDIWVLQKYKSSNDGYSYVMVFIGTCIKN